MPFQFTPGGSCQVQAEGEEEEHSSLRGVDSSYASRRESLSSEMAGLTAPDDSRVLTLAEQIIAALPERIKSDGEELMQLESSPVPTEPPSSDLDMEVILDEPPDTTSEFNFEFSDITSYRYIDVGTPSSSMSPASSSCLPSPASFTLESPSPPPTTADFSEFFHASTRDFSRDFSNLTLSDREQRELYEAAKTIQKAYRLYKGRKRLQEQDKERQAAIVIQNYYRRYKQYVYFRQMSRAATLIQNQFRSYCEHKRFKKSLEGSHTNVNFSLRGSRETTPIPTLKRTYSQRRQHQAARKIQQFMRQTKQKLQRERAQAAEREKVGQGCQVVGQGCQGPAVGGAVVGGVAIQQPLPPLLHQLPPARAGPSSEHSHRDTDPLLSSTAHAPDQNDHQGCH